LGRENEKKRYRRKRRKIKREEDIGRRRRARTGKETPRYSGRLSLGHARAKKRSNLTESKALLIEVLGKKKGL